MLFSVLLVEHSLGFPENKVVKERSLHLIESEFYIRLLFNLLSLLLLSASIFSSNMFHNLVLCSYSKEKIL